MRALLIGLALALAGCTPNQSAGYDPFTQTAGPAWSALVKSHEASGEMTCTIRGGGIDLIVLYMKARDGGKLWAVGVGANRYPGSQQFLKVDSQYFETAGKSFVGPRAAVIVAALKSGRTAAFQWSEWPTHRSHEGSLNLSGFKEAAEQCEYELL